MKEIIWKDVTSYSRTNTKKIPRVLETQIAGFNVIVHRHKDYENTWLLSCYDLKLENRDLCTDLFENAVEKAMLVLVQRLNKYMLFRKELLDIIKEQNQ